MASVRKREEMAARIVAHGNNLLAIFPNATERDPDKLSRKLRRIEVAAARGAVDYCNGEMDSDGWEHFSAAMLGKVARLLNPGDVPVFINGDPRGYTLKIGDSWVKEHRATIHRDWGGYGILAPDLTEGGGA